MSNNTDNLFETASRNKYRFESKFGSISVEDLWDIALSPLDEVAKATNAALKDCQEESFIEPVQSLGAEVLETKMALIKHVIAVRLAEQEERKNASARKAEKQRLLEILNDKQDEGLKALSVEEIKAKIAAM